MKYLVVLLLAAAVSADVRELLQKRQAIPGQFLQQPFQNLQQPAFQQFQAAPQQFQPAPQFQAAAAPQLFQPAPQQFQAIPQPAIQQFQAIPQPAIQQFQAIPQPIPQPAIQQFAQPAQFQAVQSSSQQPNWRILNHSQQWDDNGAYRWSYETENGIKAEEEGTPTRGSSSNDAAIAARGSFAYTAPDGTPISVRYVADENGFRAVGDHLPTPPPIPAEILKSLEQNAREEAQGGFRE